MSKLRSKKQIEAFSPSHLRVFVACFAQNHHGDTDDTEIAQRRNQQARRSYFYPGRRLLGIGKTDFSEANKQRRSLLERDLGVDLCEIGVVCAL